MLSSGSELLRPDFQLLVHWSLGEMVQLLSGGTQYGRALALLAHVRAA